MKRFLKIAALVVVVLVLAAGTLLGVTFMGRRPLADGQEVGNGLRVLADGFSGVVMIPVGNRQVALIDAGDDENGDVIKTELTRRQLTPDSVTAILLTHGHPDHIGAVKAFPKAQVMALQAEVALVEGRAGARGPVPRLFPVSPTGIAVTHPLTDGEVVMVGDVPIRVYAVPGHTAGSAAYVVNGALMVGDSADIASDGSLQGSPWLFSDSQSDNRASLVRLGQRLAAEGTTVTAIVPSHSGSASGLAPLTEFARRNE
jgi:glyoxylase-like metal-dependent hydrolase (beta-lactamase superfamily II)